MLRHGRLPRWNSACERAPATLVHKNRRVYSTNATGTAKARTARATVYETVQSFGLLLTRRPVRCTASVCDMTHGFTWTPSKNWTQQSVKAITCADGCFAVPFLHISRSFGATFPGGRTIFSNHRCHHAQCLVLIFLFRFTELRWSLHLKVDSFRERCLSSVWVMNCSYRLFNAQNCVPEVDYQILEKEQTSPFPHQHFFFFFVLSRVPSCNLCLLICNAWNGQL